MNYFELKKKYEHQFLDAGINEMSDFDWILVEISGKNRSMLPYYNFSTNELEKIDFAMQKRLQHIPFGYIFNKSYFFGREFYVNENTLIPRLDTEILIETILPFIKNNGDSSEILDIGTGSGAIAITLNKEANCKVTAVDISEKTLEVAKKNSENLGANIKFIQSNLFDNLKRLKFDFIVSNPPYIKSSVIDTLDKEVKDFEPNLALDGGIDGLDFYKEIVKNSFFYLKKGGMLFFEIGFDQAEDVRKLMIENFENIKVIKDYSGNDRVIFGKLRG